MAYFDNAATTFPKPECVYLAMDNFYRNFGGSFGRGNNNFSNTTKGLVEDTRNVIKELLNCPAKQVIFEPTATISLNIIIQGIIKKGAKTIYISPFEHNAVTRILHSFEKEGLIKVIQLIVNKNYQYDLERIKFQFDMDSPDAVIVSHASNVIGLISPIEDIFNLSKKYGAITVADMSQTAGLVDCNVGLDCFDFAVFAGHKTMLGPTGISGFVMKPDINLPATFFGGTGFDSSNEDMPLQLPERFEFGTMNTVGIAGLNSSVKWILNSGINNLFDDEVRKREHLIDIIKDYDYLTVVGNNVDCKYVGIVSCLFEDISSDIAGQLFSDRNIAVRTGLHCAPLAHKFLGTFPSGTIRFSVNSFTTEEDFDQLKAALDDIEESL